MEDPYREDVVDQKPVSTTPVPDAYEKLTAEPELPSPLREPELPAHVHHQKSGIVGTIGKVLLFILLFSVGVWLSSSLRQYLPTAAFPAETAVPSETPAFLLSLDQTTIATPTPADPYFDWRPYQVLSSNGRPITGVTVMLPQDVLLPVCDGSNCISQGTYLPGRTRLTMAVRGVGQPLPNPTGAILTDVSGRDFIQKDTTVAGFAATEFTGDFVGTTAGGYAFSNIRGYMIYLTTSLVLEMSLFSPSGVKTDLAPDDALFEKIVQSISAVNLSTTPCAGIKKDECSSGYVCVLDTPEVPTAGGHCIPKQ